MTVMSAREFLSFYAIQLAESSALKNTNADVIWFLEGCDKSMRHAACHNSITIQHIMASTIVQQGSGRIYHQGCHFSTLRHLPFVEGNAGRFSASTRHAIEHKSAR
jgi:hypothetical protein